MAPLPATGSTKRVLAFSAALSALAAACGGIVVIDAEPQRTATGAGGASATSTAASTSATTSGQASASATGAGGAGAGDCDELTKAYTQALGAATECSVCVEPPIDSCVGGAQLPDVCGCLVGLANNPPVVAKAEQAYKAWTEAGCGPHLCGQPCPVAEEWHCIAVGNCIGWCGPG